MNSSTSSDPMSPLTMRSVESPPVAARRHCVPVVEAGPGRKDDTGKVRTDLLPAGAIDAAGDALVRCPFIADQPWVQLRIAVADFKRNPGIRKQVLARMAASLLVLLTRELKGEVVIARALPDCGPALFAVARVLTFGASKYGPNNWQRLDDFENRYYAALLRHVFAHGGGESLDPESGLPHLAHATCGALFLLSAEVGHDPT